MNLRHLTRSFAHGALGAALAIGLAPTVAFAAPSNEADHAATPAVEAFAADFAERIEKAITTGSETPLYNASDAYDYADGDDSIASARETLPAAFDLRDQGVVTPVKLQNPWATCWGFAAIAASETSILSELGTTYAENPLDLSEHHLAWFSFTALPEDTAMYSSQAGEGYYTLDGSQASVLAPASGLTATSVLSSGIGPVPESSAPYHGVNSETGEPTIVYTPSGQPAYYSDEDDWSLDESDRFATSAELEESSILPSPAGTDENGAYTYNEAGTLAIKSEVAKGNAVSITYRADQSSPGQIADPEHYYINPETWAQYTYEQTAGNHAVTIVGWDDDYPKENFNEGHQPPEDGAWIAKNSWGANDQEFPNRNNWGIDGSGYFYLSYYDQTIGTPETFNYYIDNMPDHSPYFTIDQYDLLPSTGSTPLTSQTAMKAANVFTVDSGDSLLRSLSCETSTPNTKVTYEVYLLAESTTNPDDGTLLLTTEETYEFGGYHRVDLSEPVALPDGARYAVVVTEEAPGGTYTMPVDAGMTREGAEALAAAGLNVTRYGVAVVNKGESFLYDKGEWQDWADSRTIVNEIISPGAASLITVDNFPIKAYLDPAPVEFSDVSEGDWFYDAVQFAAYAGLIEGYGGELDSLFGPNDTMQRQDAALVLYRMLAPADEAQTSDPAVYANIANETGKPDVLDGQYYTPAVNWAYKNGIMTGYGSDDGSGAFGVGDAIDREEFATIVWRAAASGDADLSVLDDYSDGANVSEFAQHAVASLVQDGIIEGENGMIQPQRDITRAEIATMLMRWYQL